jgi:hypothetical protein
MKTKRSLTIAALALLMGNAPVSAWGPDGHYMVARLAMTRLPADMPAFFRRETDRLVFLNYEPDAWRDPEEEKLSPALRRGHDPDHHFHLELFSPEALPPDRYAFLQVLCHEGKDAASVGVLPYRAMELFQRMRVDFRQWRSSSGQQTRAFLEARILDDAGILGHYISDASEPLHVTVNSNGWALQDNPRNYTRDKTLHLRFEADFVKAHVPESEVAPLVRKLGTVNDGLPYIYEEIRRAHDQVIPLYDLEKETKFGAGDSNPRAEAFAAARLADAAATLRDLWYAAYRGSGGQ